MKNLHWKFRRSLDYSYQGFALGAAILALWLCCLWAGLSLDLESGNAIVIPMAMLLQTLLVLLSFRLSLGASRVSLCVLVEIAQRKKSLEGDQSTT